MTTKGNNQSQVNARELALDILYEILEKDGYSHLVLNQALSKYQYLGKQDRSLITRITEGTLEYLIQIDAVIDQFSKTKVRKLKPLIRTLLRMSVYQILYMDRIPDSAVCNEAVKLAVKRHFQGLKGFVNGVLRTISREKDHLEFSDEAVRFSVPAWLLELWKESYDETTRQKMFTYFLEDHPLTVRCNIHLASKEEIFASLKDQQVNVEKCPYGDSMLYLSGYDHLEALEAFRNGWIQVQDVSKIYKLYDKPIDRLKESLSLTHKNYHKDFFALSDISFNVKKGETVGIIGTNGSGKSTVLKIITGVLQPTMGNVTVNGRISALLELGAGFNPEYSGMENIFLNGTMLGFSEEEINARLDEILSFADIGDFIHQPVKTYSSGMFVRLAFAVAINIDPEILVVDEALSVGDVFFQAKCYHKFEEFKKQGKTILFVSHDLGSISKYCDRVILLNQGVMLDEGTPKAMVDMYKQLLVHQDPVKQAEGSDTKKEDWKQGFLVNPNTLEYGEKQAEITDFVVMDSKGLQTNTIEKGSKFQIKMRIHFHESIQQPIMAFTFKNIQGTEITGTNTMYEGVNVEHTDAGDECVVVFEQKMDMQGGEYLLSFGCTGYRNGDFTVFHRLYDACNITVVSSKNTVGFYDMNSKVWIEE